MTVAEALSDFQKVLNNPNSTLDDLSQIVKEISVFDNVAPDDAVTHLYTKVGTDKSFITDTVRALDHTEAFEFLDAFDDEIKNFAKNIIGRENPNLGSDEIAKLADNFLYGNFDDAANITKGLWGDISERFEIGYRKINM